MKTQKEIPDRQRIKNEVKRYILDNHLPGEDWGDLMDNDLLFEGGIIDSGGAFAFISFLEDRFNVEVLDEELFPENFASVTHVVEFVTAKCQER